jgi:hypothetical protein
VKVFEPLKECRSDGSYALEASPLSWAAYRRTGNGLKAFVFYVGDREAFMQQFNERLTGAPPLAP